MTSRPNFKDDASFDDYLQHTVTHDPYICAARKQEDLDGAAILTKAREALESGHFPLEKDRLQQALNESRDKRSTHLTISRSFRSQQILGYGLLVVEFALLFTATLSDVSTWLYLVGFAAGISALAGSIYVLHQADSRKRSQLVAKGVANALADHERFEATLIETLRAFVVLPAMRSMRPPRFTKPSDDKVLLGDAPYLSSRTEDAARIETRSYNEALLSMRRTGGATIGLAGPRGAGKSEMLRAFCEAPTKAASIEDGGTVGVVIPAPVAYAPDPFLRMVIRRLAEAVPRNKPPSDIEAARKRRSMLVVGALSAACLGSGLYLRYGPSDFPERRDLGTFFIYIGGIAMYLVALIVAAIFLNRLEPKKTQTHGDEENAAKINRRLRHDLPKYADAVAGRIRHLETRQTAKEGSLALGKVATTKLGRVTTQTDLPFSQADLLTELEGLVQALHHAGYQVVIGIDELDKLDASDGAAEFLNGIKVLFGINDCSFIVTISESAWASFTRRGIDVRDVFDSSLDETVQVAPLDLDEARSMMRWRGEKMTDTQVLFCYCMSGGLPRDLIRYCWLVRKIGHRSAGSASLSAVINSVLDQEWRDQLQGAVEAARGCEKVNVPAFVADVERVFANIEASGVDDLKILAAQDPTFVSLSRRENGNGSAPAQAESGIQPDSHIRRQLCAYAFLSHTIRQAFGDAGPLGGPDTDDNKSILAAYDALAKARQRLELDAAAGWRQTAQARVALGLDHSPPTPQPTPAMEAAAVNGDAALRRHGSGGGLGRIIRSLQRIHLGARQLASSRR